MNLNLPLAKYKKNLKKKISCLKNLPRLGLCILNLLRWEIYKLKSKQPKVGPLVDGSSGQYSRYHASHNPHGSHINARHIKILDGRASPKIWIGESIYGSI